MKEENDGSYETAKKLIEETYAKSKQAKGTSTKKRGGGGGGGGSGGGGMSKTKSELAALGEAMVTNAAVDQQLRRGSS